MVVDLPTELWLRIAHFLPDSTLYALAPASRLFHALATDRRFRHLLIDDDRPAALVRKLARIERDPSVAPRVRALTIHPTAVRSACIKAARAHTRPRKPSSALWPASFRASPPEEDTVLADRLLAALALLPSLGAFAVEWHPAPTHISHTSPSLGSESSFCLPLLAALASRLPPTLRALSLDMGLGHIAMLAPVLKDAVRRARVREVKLRFVSPDPSGAPTPATADARALTAIASLIKSTRSTLASLALASAGHADVSPLYAALCAPPPPAQLDVPSASHPHASLSSSPSNRMASPPPPPLPHLTHLNLRLPCDASHLAAAPAALHAFLRAQGAGLRVFEAGFRWCCAGSPVNGNHYHVNAPAQGANGNSGHPHGMNGLVQPHSRLSTFDGDPTNFMSNTFGGVSFPRLRVLDLKLNRGEAGVRVLPAMVCVVSAVAGKESDTDEYDRCWDDEDGDSDGHSGGEFGEDYSRERGKREGEWRYGGLEVLKIDGCIIALDDLRALISPFGFVASSATNTPQGDDDDGVLRGLYEGRQDARSQGPQRLVLEVHVLDAALLSLIARALPGLRRLDLTYKWVGRVGVVDVPHLETTLRPPALAAWMSLLPVNVHLRCARPDDASRGACQQVIIACLPRRPEERGDKSLRWRG